MKLMKYQIEQALLNIQNARQYIDKQREESDNEYLDNYHYEMLDIELRLKDMLNHIHKL